MKHLFECYYHFFLSNTQNQIKKNKIISAGHGPLGLFFSFFRLVSCMWFALLSLCQVFSGEEAMRFFILQKRNLRGTFDDWGEREEGRARKSNRPLVIFFLLYVLSTQKVKNHRSREPSSVRSRERQRGRWRTD